MACDSGRFTMTWNDEDFPLSTGDSLEIAFDACQFVDAATAVDAVAAVTGIVMTGDPLNAILPWSLEPFMAAVDGNPHSGQMRIADPTSSVLVTVIDTINVELQVDENLDGVIDATQVTTWASLGFE